MTVDALLSRADLLLRQNRPKEAEKELLQVLQQEPDNDYALSMLGRSKYDQRQFNEGIGLIQQAIRVDPQNGYYFYLLAFGYYQADSNHSAKRYLQRAIELAPYAADFHGLLAMILLEEKDFKQALEKANEGLAIDAENITCLNARSTALNKLRRVDDAISTMQDALQQDPENAFTHTTIGWNLLEKGKHKEADRHFREALRINPNLEGARAGLKESMKSKIAPYRWLLQYSFWINNKGRKARWIIPFGLIIIIQLVSELTKRTDNPGVTLAGNLVIGIYLLFVLTSWLINPMANFFLLFYKDGRYALTTNEKWNAITTVTVLLTGIAIMIASQVIQPAPLGLFMGGLTIFSLALPMGHLKIPIQFRSNPTHQWFTLSLVLTGLITAVLFFAGLAIAETVAAVYLVAFVLFSWIGVFSSR
ncbi:MAG: tetratricopeptide repeat protein [Chitinophagaceae bacterium]